MVSTLSVIIFDGALVAIAFFFIWCMRRRPLQLLAKLFMALAFCYAIWIIPLIIMHFVDETNRELMFFLDCCTSPGGLFAPTIYACIATAFVADWEKLPKKLWLAFIAPAAGVIVAFTNPLHHLQYQVFSTVKEQIVFGPFVLINGIYSYFCLTVGMVIMTSFAWKNKSRLYMMQCAAFAVGGLCPLVVSMIATFSKIDMPITATPISFMVPLVMLGLTIYRMHFLDIKPIATQHVLDWISDCYMVLSHNGLVIAYNRQFEAIFASKYGIAENRYLKDCVKEEDVSKKTAVFNMITALQSCQDSMTTVSYEQAMILPKGTGAKKLYYICEVSPLRVSEKTAGYVIIYKDITKLRESMKQLESNKERMLEQERLAFLGQMIGGLAHNLKTPIMSISGSISAQDALIDECDEGLNDPLMTKEDYQEIFEEAREWNRKMRESMTYMSDIITAIKGQAANAVTTDHSQFTLDEAIDRCKLLMRHELLSGQCTLVIHMNRSLKYSLHGDINNLVQVLNNLISNAIYAQHLAGGGQVTLDVGIRKNLLEICVIDTGPGVSEKVKGKLFKAMVTNKGAKGTGLGLYISNAIIRGKLDGEIWHQDNPGGGSIFGISIPMEHVTVTETERKAE